MGTYNDLATSKDGATVFAASDTQVLAISSDTGRVLMAIHCLGKDLLTPCRVAVDPAGPVYVAGGRQQY